MPAFVAFGPIPVWVQQPHFFARPWVDVIRVLCVVLAVLMVMWSIRVVCEQIRLGPLQPGQLDRFIFLWLAAISIAYTEIVVQGSPMTWRLPINVLALIFGVRGVYLMRREQKRR
jgi:hypothetical protein